MNKKAIVIGASSGIGEALAKVLARNGYDVGLAARRVKLLEKIQQEIPTHAYIKRIDVSKCEEAIALLQELIQEMGGMDLIMLNSGINTHNINFEWKGEIDTIDVNISGLVAMVNVAIKYFSAQNSGHIVGISSIASLWGSSTCSAYNASKAFVSNYLQGLRWRLSAHNIYVTDIRPGLVDTALIRGSSVLFWVSTPQGAAEQIFAAIKKKRKVAYITKRWGIIAWLIKMMPDWLRSSIHRKAAQIKVKQI